MILWLASWRVGVCYRGVLVSVQCMGHQWSGCIVRIKLQLRLPHSIHCPLSMSTCTVHGGGGDSSGLDANTPPHTNRWLEAPLGGGWERKDQAYMSFYESSCKKSITVHVTLIVPHERGGDIWLPKHYVHVGAHVSAVVVIIVLS